MRPKLLALAGVLAILAFAVWPDDGVREEALQSASTGSAPAEPTKATATPLLAVGLAVAALAAFLQGFRPETAGVPDEA